MAGDRWYALGVAVSWEGTVESELRRLVGESSVYVPRHIIECWNRAARRVKARTQLLMPGYMMVRGEGIRLDTLDHASRVWWLRAPGHAQLPIPHQQVAALMLRQIMGEFDVRSHRGVVGAPVLPHRGARVRVVLFNWLGTVRRIVNRYAEVVLDGGYQPILVAASGMEVLKP